MRDNFCCEDALISVQEGDKLGGNPATGSHMNGDNGRQRAQERGSRNPHERTTWPEPDNRNANEGTKENKELMNGDKGKLEAQERGSREPT